MIIRNQKPLLGTPLRKGHNLAKGLVGCWLMNEGGGNQVFDLSGYKNDGTLVNGPVWTGGSLVFDGDTSDQQVNLGSLQNLFADEVTVIIRCKDTASAGFDFLFNNYLSTTDAWGIAAAYAQGVCIFDDIDNNGNFNYQTVTTVGQWYHVAATIESDLENRLYIDGKLVGSGTSSTGGFGSFAGSMYFAGRGIDNYHRACVIDYCFIYNRALTASEIAQLYREPFCMFKRMPIHRWAGAYGGAGPSQTMLDYERALRGVNRGVIRGAA